MAGGNVMIWLLLPLLFIGYAAWHVRENRRLARRWEGEFDAASARWLAQFAWSRSAQMLLALAACILIILVYDRQLGQARIEREEWKKLQAGLADLRASVTGATEKMTAAAAQMERKPFAAAAPAAQPLVAPAPAAVQPVQEVFDGESGAEATFDSMKKRYEDILVTHLFMVKCGMADTAHYAMIISALRGEAKQAGAPEEMENDILSAARGSYQEVYAQSKCDAEGMSVLQQQYAEYIAQLAPIPAAGD